jgi:hypothetical protein
MFVNITYQKSLEIDGGGGLLIKKRIF